MVKLLEAPRKENPATDKFLEKWDRQLNDDRRCYGIKLCLAGAESQQFRDILYRVGARNILISYYYAKNWLNKTPLQDLEDELGRFDFLLLDSGGFTFLEEERKGKSAKISIEEYTEEYYDSVKRFGHLFSGCAEVDLPHKIGVEYSEKKRLELWEAGIPIFPVIRDKPISFYEKLGWFDIYPYFAIGSIFLNDPKYQGHVQDVMEAAKRHNVLIHGFAATDNKTFTHSQFYSVDSTSWISGGKYGATMFFQNGVIRTLSSDNKSQREILKQRSEENGIIWENVQADKWEEVNAMNALAWRQMGDYLKYTAHKCYWLTDEEKSHALDLKQRALNSEGIIDSKTSLERAKFRRLSQVTDANEDDRAHEVLYCDTCNMTGRCPRYKAGSPCGYDINIRLETKDDLQKALKVLIESQYGRVMSGVLFEKLSGGALNKDLSAEIQRLVALVQDVRGIFEPPRDELHIHAKGQQGALSNMLASVFAPTGKGGSGSGSSTVQRAANKVIDVSPLDDVSIEEK